MEERKTRILIIEDNSNDVSLLMRQLKKGQMDDQVKVLSDGEKAIDFFRSQVDECDGLVAVFLDLKLPQVSGLDVLTALRSHASPRVRNLPVIVMTSSHFPQDLEKCRKLGVTHYVQKPMTFTAFVKAVAHRFHVPPEAKGQALGRKSEWGGQG